MNSNLPIGIFDSGIGGLTVAREIIDLMPMKRLSILEILFTYHTEKNQRKSYQLLLKICQFLAVKNCKAIVIACNSASSLAQKN